MHAADQIVAIDVAIGHQGAAVRAAPIQHADGVVKAGNDQVNVRDQRIRRRSIFKLFPVFLSQFMHITFSCFSRFQ